MKSAYVPKAMEMGGDCLMLNHYPLALSIAKKYYQGVDFDAEIRGAAIEGLAQACYNIDSGSATAEAPKAYIAEFVTGHIKDAMRRRRMIYMPNSTVSWKTKRNISTETATVLRDITGDVRTSLYLRHATTDFNQYADTLDDYLKELHFDDDEIRVLKLRMEGKSVREVADCMTIKKSMVGLILKAMKRKWKNWLTGE